MEEKVIQYLEKYWMDEWNSEFELRGAGSVYRLVFWAFPAYCYGFLFNCTKDNL